MLGLSGVSKLTISIESILLQEANSSEFLLHGATVIPETVQYVQSLVRNRHDVFLLCHVDDDIGEAVVIGALEHCGLVGESKHDQIPAHRVLFCGSSRSKVSMVRQLEPQLHIEADDSIVSSCGATVFLHCSMGIGWVGGME